MMHLTLSTIAEKVGKKVIGGTGQEKLKDISIDSRTLEPSDLFVALKGPDNDGHDYLKDAMEKGAAAFVIEKKKLLLISHISL
jgi:UDP-N-acetylmuramoyl-tripeptide--D-alanyl-D-alanine ligase